MKTNNMRILDWIFNVNNYRDSCKEKVRISRLSEQEVLNEQQILFREYRRKYPRLSSPFLVGSSLVGNILGDSEYFWELTKRLDKLKS